MSTRRLAAVVVSIVAVAALIGCAGPAQHVHGSGLADGSIADWDRPARRPLGRAVPRRAAAGHAATVRGPERDANRPRRAPSERIDVRFRRAELTDALRLLADAARVQLVVGAELSTEVTLSLRRVTPWEALETVAVAHGATVTRRGDVVIVTGR